MTEPTRSDDDPFGERERRLQALLSALEADTTALGRFDEKWADEERWQRNNERPLRSWRQQLDRHQLHARVGHARRAAGWFAAWARAVRLGHPKIVSLRLGNAGLAAQVAVLAAVDVVVDFVSSDAFLILLALLFLAAFAALVL